MAFAFLIGVVFGPVIYTALFGSVEMVMVASLPMLLSLVWLLALAQLLAQVVHQVTAFAAFLVFQCAQLAPRFALLPQGWSPSLCLALCLKR